MSPRFLSVVLAALLAAGAHPVLAQGADSEAEKGVRQAQEGDFEQAVLTLQAALPRLLERKATHDIARVHLYLGIAQLGLNDAVAARASFVEALRADPALKVSDEEFPPRIVRAFEEARRSLPQAPAATAATTTAPPASVSAPTSGTPTAAPSSAEPAKPRPATAKKGGSKLPYVLLGVGAAGGGIALAAGGGGGGGSSTPSTSVSTPVTTTPPSPTGTVNLVASFPAAGQSVQLPADPLAGSAVPEITFDVVYGADVPQAYFEINLWRGPDLCFSSQAAYASRLDSGGVQYKAGTTARFRLNWWTTRQPGCGSSFVTDRFEFFWGRPTSSLFVQNLALGWSFKR